MSIVKVDAFAFTIGSQVDGLGFSNWVLFLDRMVNHFILQIPGEGVGDLPFSGVLGPCLEKHKYTAP